MWDIAGNISLGAGHKLNSSEILFKKIEDRLIEQQVEKLKLVLESNSEEDNEIKEISMEQFDKIDLKVAEIIEAIILPKADKLFKLQVKLGEEERQIIAGLAQHYQAKDLIGKKVVIVANLKPIKILGELSEGMLLTAKSGSDIALITTDKNMLSGSIIR